MKTYFQNSDFYLKKIQSALPILTLRQNFIKNVTNGNPYHIKEDKKESDMFVGHTKMIMLIVVYVDFEGIGVGNDINETIRDSKKCLFASTRLNIY